MPGRRLPKPGGAQPAAVSCNRLLCCTRHGAPRAPRRRPAPPRRAKNGSCPQTPAASPRIPHAVTESLGRAFERAFAQRADPRPECRRPRRRSGCRAAEPAQPPALRPEQPRRPREGNACCITDMRFSCRRARSSLPRAPALTRFRPLAYTEVRAGAYRPQHVSDRGCSCNRLLCCTRHRWRRAPRPCPRPLPHEPRGTAGKPPASLTPTHARSDRKPEKGIRNGCPTARPPSLETAPPWHAQRLLELLSRRRRRRADGSNRADLVKALRAA